jgi:hypothetical protein
MEKLPLNPVTGAESQITKPDGRWGRHTAYNNSMKVGFDGRTR